MSITISRGQNNLSWSVPKAFRVIEEIRTTQSKVDHILFFYVIDEQVIVILLSWGQRSFFFFEKQIWRPAGLGQNQDLPNERATALFHHFFLQFLHIVKIRQTAHNTTISIPPVPSILQILITFNLYSGRPRMGLLVNNKQKVRKAMVKISRGDWHHPLCSRDDVTNYCKFILI